MANLFHSLNICFLSETIWFPLFRTKRSKAEEAHRWFPNPKIGCHFRSSKHIWHSVAFRHMFFSTCEPLRCPLTWSLSIVRWQFCKEVTTMPDTPVPDKSLHKTLPSTTLYYKACKKHSPVLLCTTKLAQSTPQYYFVLQELHKKNTSQYYFVLKSLHKALPSTTLYYKTCTKHSPVLLCTAKVAQNNSQYYFVLQSLHKLLPSNTLYYKACTKHSPVLLCTTKVAQSTPLYYFVLQSLHKPLPSTTLYYKACTKHSPILLCTAIVAQNNSQY